MATILAVDDRPTDRKLLVTLFQDRHRVLEAADGAQALELMRAEHPDLVISDVLLPKMDGYEFVRQMRGDPAISGTPVIFYTAAFNEQEARDLARDFGVVLTLSKPTDPQEILEKVTKVLSNESAREKGPLAPHFQKKHQQLLVDKLLHQVEALHQEIIERKLVELKLKKTLEDLERSNKELEEFAYVASHDLKEPLRKMAGFSDLLAKDYRDQLDERAQKYLGYIADGAAHMQELINDLLAYARVGKTDFPLILADLEEILRGALNDIPFPNQETGAEISHDPLPTLKVNPYKMGRLFQNLISNALKFSGGKPARIHISARQEGQEWIISVHDNGIGFDPRHAETIFKVFKRLHSKEKFSGTGIGLAICKKIVERHGGRIWAESEPGQGATFYFTIPA